ncbi:hypothetical protein K501DRAFT_270516 [Backusella circina FSU 941]|nr:hypothetical protein K501DRAFT_270516 [Backusella circina FSU 941]
MDKLPVEILHWVFIELHMRQRLEYTLACRQWVDILPSRSLFHSVTISFVNMHDRFLNMIERFSEKTNQVDLRLFTWSTKEEMHLLLENVGVSLDDMEKIHGSIPSLDPLYIKECNLRVSILPIGEHSFIGPDELTESEQELSIAHVELPKDVDKNIGKHFPSLKKPKIYDCLAANASLSLLDHDLLELNIGVMVADAFDIKEFRTLSTEANEDNGFMKITCGSIRNLIVDNFALRQFFTFYE